MRGSQIQRVIEFFKTEDIEVARIALERSREILEERLEAAEEQRKAAKRAPDVRPKRTRRTKAQINADNASQRQTTIEDGAKAAGAAATTTI